MRIFQKGFNYLQDGQGNRLVYHLQGCNMRCRWCTNPEGLSLNGTIMAHSESLCDEFCPHGAISNRELNRDICNNCSDRECISLHRGTGIRLSCQNITVDEVISEVLSSSILFYDGGGVTFTGGECTLQFEELRYVLRELQNHHINTAIETNASHSRLHELFECIDHIIIDCKHTDNDTHLKWTGIDNHTILENIKLAAEFHSSVHIRVPLIGGVNNSIEDIKSFVEFFRSIAKENISFEILTYHEYGKKKWNECGLEYQMTDNAKIKPEEVAFFRAEIERAGLNYRRT